MFPRMTTDQEGAPWATWQEVVNGHFEILAARYRNGVWQAPIRVSETTANNWHPAIAAGPDGAVYIAWDSYASGNYDVFFRVIRSGQAQPVVRVTRSDTFNAHVTLAVDPGEPCLAGVGFVGGELGQRHRRGRELGSGAPLGPHDPPGTL